MALIYLLFLFSIICISSLIGAIAIAFTSYFYYSIALVMPACLSFLLLTIVFYKLSRNCLNYKIDNYYHFEKYIDKHNIIKFKYENKKWILDDEKFVLEFSFKKEFIFQKSYILAFLVRNLRYKYIKNQKPIACLFKKKFKISNNEKIIAIFIKDNKTKQYVISNNGRSKYTFLSREITKSKFACHLYYTHFNNEYLSVIENVNERFWDEYMK